MEFWFKNGDLDLLNYLSFIDSILTPFLIFNSVESYPSKVLLFVLE